MADNIKKNSLGGACKPPPTKLISSTQIDLFSTFISNDENKVTNTVDVWESIPKYSISAKQQNKLRTEQGLAEPQKREYLYRETACSVLIQPALIEQKKGGYKAFFPGTTEELVEEALKKIFTDQAHGYHDPKAVESWVKFSLKMIHRELKKNGKERNLTEIKHAIEVMSSTLLVFSQNGKEVWRGTILQDLVTINRKDYLANTDMLHAARLPLFISQAVNNLEYRQINYNKLMSFENQLTRWIYKRLVNRFKQASLMNTYHFMFASIRDESKLLDYPLERDNRKTVIRTLNSLIKNKVLIQFDTDSKKEGRKIVDVKYTLYPTPEFITDQKAANKRNTNNVTKLK